MSAERINEIERRRRHISGTVDYLCREIEDLTKERDALYAEDNALWEELKSLTVDAEK